MAKTMMTIMFMYDNGKSYTLRLRIFYYKFICSVFIILPILLGLSITACYYLWENNRFLKANTLLLQIETDKAKALAANLAIFKKLLDEDHPINASAILMNQAEGISEEAEKQAQIDLTKELDGPGHVEFPAIDTKKVVIENISARMLDEGKIRISLDLRNPDPKIIISGLVNCIFVDSNGISHSLDIAKDLRLFKINRFKRVVFLPNISADIVSENANVLIEVYDDAGNIMYRNISPIAH